MNHGGSSYGFEVTCVYNLFYDAEGFVEQTRYDRHPKNMFVDRIS